MFGKAALITSYEARIKDLRDSHASEIQALLAHIESLKRLVFPPQNTASIPLHQLEADAILSVRETTIELTDDELKQREEEISERDRVLSGMY